MACISKWKNISRCRRVDMHWYRVLEIYEVDFAAIKNIWTPDSSLMPNHWYLDRSSGLLAEYLLVLCQKVSTMSLLFTFEYFRRTLLHHEQTVAFLERNPVPVNAVSSAVCPMRRIYNLAPYSKLSSRSVCIPRVLVIRREPRWVRRLGDLAIHNLLQRVLALAIRSEGVHEMHSCSRWAVSVPVTRVEVVVRVGENATSAAEISVAS